MNAQDMLLDPEGEAERREADEGIAWWAKWSEDGERRRIGPYETREEAEAAGARVLFSARAISNYRIARER